MGNYVIFNYKQGSPSLIFHELQVHADEKLPANIVRVSENYYCPGTEGMNFLASAIPKISIQKAEKRTPKIKIHVFQLHQAVHQG